MIFGLFGLPEMGIGGAAAATAAGQIAAALIVMKKGFRKPPAKKLFPHHVSNIFRLGMPNILMQTCIVPVISFNYAAKNIDRCKKVLKSAILFGLSLISIGTICFLCIPGQMLLVFTSDKTVSVFPFRAYLVLADLSGYRDSHQPGRRILLPAVFTGKSLIE